MATSHPPLPSSSVTSQCACGQVQIRATVSSSPRHERVDCHCPTCRKFHTSAFVSYLPVSEYQVLQGNTVTYGDVCSGLWQKYEDGNGNTAESTAAGPQQVNRLLCRRCYSKLLTTAAFEEEEVADKNEAEAATTSSTTRDSRGRRAWINMGPLLEGKGRFPTSLLSLEPRAVGGPPVGWYVARPNTAGNDEEDDEEEEEDLADKDEVPFQFAHGRCSCGQTRYRILVQDTELQHCYCRLCRQYSGGPFMTWIPAPFLEWLDASGQPCTIGPTLVRTTSHGQRHFCPTCHACLTIVYDDQPDTIWPVAASLEDATALNLYGVTHICCRYRPKWYSLPKDGLPRLQEAS